MLVPTEHAKALYEHHLKGKHSRWDNSEVVQVTNYLPGDLGVSISWDQIKSGVVTPPHVEIEYVAFHRRLYRNGLGKYHMVVFQYGNIEEIAREPIVPWWEEGPYKR